MTERKRPLIIAGAVAVAALVVIAVVLATHSSGGGSASSASQTTTGQPASSVDPAPTTTSAAGPTTTVAATGTTKPPASPTTTQPIPLKVSASATSNLHDGQAVTVKVTADPGSSFYGMDARLCAATPAIANFYDYTPDPAGNCILHPLSADSDAYLEVPVPAPNRTGTLTFRVGVGTNKFTTENLNQVAITCGPGHPCQLVVRLQYPNGFGFRSFPVTYAG